MIKYRRTRTISDIDWTFAFAAYEALYQARIDGAVPQAWYDEHMDEIGRRLGACWVYGDRNILGKPMYRDEILMALGISLGYEEVPSDTQGKAPEGS